MYSYRVAQPLRTRSGAWPVAQRAARRRLSACMLAVALALSVTTALAPSASAESFSASSWGYNGSGQLGNNSTTLSRTPVAVQGLSEVVALAGGSEFSLALLGNGKMMSWGNNREGQLGNGSTANSHVPVAITNLATLGGVSAIAAGGEFGLALLPNGTVLAWGANEEGQLGNGKTARVTAPAAVKGLSGVTAIAAGAEFALARLSNGTVMSWGCGGEGQLGNGKRSRSLAPVAVKGLSGVTAIAAGAEFALARLSNGTVMSWGANQSSQLGVPAETKNIGEGEVEEIEIVNSDIPLEVQALSGVTAIAAGAEHGLALLGDGEVMAWGGNGSDQLGNGSAGGASNVPSPVVGLGGVTAIAAGSHHSLAILSGGAVVAWGYNPDGQLGNGSNLNSPVPVSVTGLGKVAGIAAGGAHSLSFGPPPPSVTGLSPSQGPQQGGSAVTISGANLGEATAVNFGTNPASSFTVDSASSITAVSPAGSGTVDVTVTSPVSSSAPNAADKFEYLPPPTVTKVKANKGPAAGGTTTTITGTSLTGTAAVRFGANPASSFTVDSASSITAVSPAGTSGSVDVTVTSASATSPISSHDVFKYEAPTITSLSPNTGPVSGGTSVTVSGSGFAPGAGATTFTFGKASATGVECASTSSCVLVTPATKKPSAIQVGAAVGKAKSKKNPLTDQFSYE
jgi:alpha-tubulin suppressor-like RCC1 family protein